ncbi:MAG TPA: ABC transporter permease subunit [Urbifossiella sp.]|jgi:ABC-type transport system involved in multi-copper enzyme maturation permease subunit|nr:ABC transporter permease subunit [Urbifossiella sp.]
MGQFVAILKDSFREAVDGFVIYLMLGLSVLLIVLVASISYVPASATAALPQLLEGKPWDPSRFQVIFPDRGKSTSPTGVPARIDYRPADIQDTTNGAKFVLRIRPHRDDRPRKMDMPGDKAEVKEPAEDDPADDPKGPDGFRWAVLAWTKPAGEKVNNPFAEKARKANPNKAQLEIVTPPAATEADLKAVSDDDMAAFLKYQFATFAGTDGVTITRRAGAAEPRYEFDVQINGISGARGWPHEISVLFGAFPPMKGFSLGQALSFIEDQLVNGIGSAVALMISVVITAFFIPNLLRKGSVDLLISKPIGRVQLLVYKYVGGLTFIFLIACVAVGGVWLVTGVRSGSWDPSFLLVIPVLTFTFAILYAVSVVVAVFTRSAIAAILVTLGFMLFLYIFGQVKAFFDMNKVLAIADLPDWSYTLVDVLNNVLPRYKDLDRLTSRLVADSTRTLGDARLQGLLIDYPSWGGTIGVSLGFIALMLALASWRFVKRDY